jgi:hypothetical protein
VIEKAFEMLMANQEGWAVLGMSGDELTTHIVKQQQQHAYGTSENGLIGCDGGPKYGRNYDGTKDEGTTASRPVRARRRLTHMDKR